jgi:hypothetical protein
MARPSNRSKDTNNSSDTDALNIMEHPQFHGSIAQFGKNTQWSTVGDLHGNFMCFLYFAVARGAMKISLEDYHELAVIYNNWSESKDLDTRRQQKATFNELVAKIEVAPQAKLRLIGDELDDRGQDDALTLEPLAGFKEKGGIYETILSNHTAGFILCIEEAIQKATINGVFNEEKFKKDFIAQQTFIQKLQPEAANSFANLQYSLEHGIISVKDLLEKYNSHKSTFKAFSYDYDVRGKIMIYSHAPMGRAMICAVALGMIRYLNDEEKNTVNAMVTKFDAQEEVTDNDMPPIIDAINRVVALKAQSNTLSDIINKESALYDAVENRKNPKDNMNNTHGHDPTEFRGRISLDSFCGKYLEFFYSELLTIAKTTRRLVNDLQTLNYTTSFPWGKTPPSQAELDQEIPEEPQFDEAQQASYQAYRWVGEITPPMAITHPHPWDEVSALKLYGYKDREDLPEGLMVFRALLFQYLFTYVGNFIDAISFAWVENKAGRVVTFPLRVLGEAIKFPLTVISGAVGTLIGVLCSVLAQPNSAPWWQPIVAGLSNGLRPFAPNAAEWVERYSLNEKPENVWSWSYVGALVTSLLFVNTVIAASAIIGDGPNLDLIMPFGLLSPGLSFLSGGFGAVSPYIAASVFIGGLTSLLSGIVNAFSWVFGKEKKQVVPIDTIIPDSGPQKTLAAAASTTAATSSTADPIPGATQQGQPVLLSTPANQSNRALPDAGILPVI